MTAFLPLEAATPLPPSPAFLVPSPDPAHHMKRVVKAVLKARRIAVVCGEWRGYVLPWCAVGSLNAVLQVLVSLSRPASLTSDLLRACFSR